MATYRGACNVCYAGKVKCVRGPEGGACVRCQNAGRECVYAIAGKVGRPRRASGKPRPKTGSASSSPPHSTPPTASPMSRSETSASACSSVVFNLDGPSTGQHEQFDVTSQGQDVLFSWEHNAQYSSPNKAHLEHASPIAAYGMDWASLGFDGQNLDASSIPMPLASSNTLTNPLFMDTQPDFSSRPNETVSNPALVLSNFPPSPPPTKYDAASSDPNDTLNKLANIQYEMAKLRHENKPLGVLAEPIFSSLAAICSFTRSKRSNNTSGSSSADQQPGFSHSPQFSMLLLTLSAMMETLDHFLDLTKETLSQQQTLGFDCGPFASGDAQLDTNLAMSVLGFYLRQLGRDLSTLRDASAPGGYTLTMLSTVVERMQNMHVKLDDCRSFVR